MWDSQQPNQAEDTPEAATQSIHSVLWYWAQTILSLGDTRLSQCCAVGQCCWGPHLLSVLPALPRKAACRYVASLFPHRLTTRGPRATRYWLSPFTPDMNALNSHAARALSHGTERMKEFCSCSTSFKHGRQCRVGQREA